MIKTTTGTSRYNNKMDKIFNKAVLLRDAQNIRNDLAENCGGSTLDLINDLIAIEIKLSKLK